MNLKRIAVLGLLLGALGFAGATTAQAAPFHELSCIKGYEPAEGSMTECVPIQDATTPDDSVNGCWVNEDGIDVCARSGVVEDPMPTGVDETPVPAPMACTDVESDCVAKIYFDEPCTDPEACPEIMFSTSTPVSGEVKAYDAMTTTDNSGYLLTLGLITALLGAVAILLSRREFSKK